MSVVIVSELLSLPQQYPDHDLSLLPFTFNYGLVTNATDDPLECCPLSVYKLPWFCFFCLHR